MLLSNERYKWTIEGTIDGERLQRLLHPASFREAGAMAVNERLEEQMTRHLVFVEDNKRPLKPDDQSHEPAKHIEETARLAGSVETAKDPGKVRRTKD
jgi:hypothetical protein